jgi:signal recognition particle subunit SRP54
MMKKMKGKGMQNMMRGMGGALGGGSGGGMGGGMPPMGGLPPGGFPRR